MMKKKLTLNQTWKYCLQMWEWIAKQVAKAIKEGRSWDIEDLKEEWMKNHPRFDGEIDHNCFFCEYDEQRDGCNCEFCPLRLISKRFQRLHCANKSHDFKHKPLKFYAKLLELNKKRKSK